METLKVFLIPSEPVFSKIVRLKSLVKNQIGSYWYADYEPHISLLYLKTGSEQLPPVCDIVQSEVSKLPPFDVTLGGVVTPGRGIIFVDIEKSIPLRDLTNGLHKAVKDYLTSQAVPYEDLEKYLRHHITIGNYIKGDNYSKACKCLENEKLPIMFKAERVVFYREDPQSRKNQLIREFILTA